jgi:hypothetical protein
MLAHGFTVALMVELIRAGLATSTPERVVGGRRDGRDRAQAGHRGGRQTLAGRSL